MTTNTIKGHAWLLDGDGDLWVAVGLDDTGTMLAYLHTDDVTGGARNALRSRRLLSIEDAYGIKERGPEVVMAGPAT